MPEINAEIQLTHVQPGDKIVRDGQRYNVVEPSQVQAQLLPKAKTSKTYLLKLTCGCDHGTFRATAKAVLSRTYQGERIDINGETMANGDTGLDCRVCKQAVKLAEASADEAGE